MRIREFVLLTPEPMARPTPRLSTRFVAPSHQTCGERLGQSAGAHGNRRRGRRPQSTPQSPSDRRRSRHRTTVMCRGCREQLGHVACLAPASRIARRLRCDRPARRSRAGDWTSTVRPIRGYAGQTTARASGCRVRHAASAPAIWPGTDPRIVESIFRKMRSMPEIDQGRNRVGGQFLSSLVAQSATVGGDGDDRTLDSSDLSGLPDSSPTQCQERLPAALGELDGRVARRPSNHRQ